MPSHSVHAGKLAASEIYGEQEEAGHRHQNKPHTFSSPFVPLKTVFPTE
jgi:hypothetical protein